MTDRSDGIRQNQTGGADQWMRIPGTAMIRTAVPSANPTIP